MEFVVRHGCQTTVIEALDIINFSFIDFLLELLNNTFGTEAMLTIEFYSCFVAYEQGLGSWFDHVVVANRTIFIFIIFLGFFLLLLLCLIYYRLSCAPNLLLDKCNEMSSVLNFVEVYFNVIGVGRVNSLGEHVRCRFGPSKIRLTNFFHYGDIRLIGRCLLFLLLLDCVLLLALFTDVTDLELVKITSLQIIALTF